MTHALFIDNDMGSLVLFEEICKHGNIQYTGILNSSHVEAMLPKLLSLNIIFVDMEMPHLNGYQVLGVLRSYPMLKTIPIVACTVYTEELEKARKAGFSSFILKPINVDRFPQQIAEILNGQTIWENHAS